MYNTHQPASDKHEFRPAQRIAFCKAIVRDSNEFAKTEKDLIGTVLGGNANCSISQWTTAMWEPPPQRYGKMDHPY